MTQNTKIEWADHTFNPWWGCTKVSPACDHCYAAALDKRTGGDHWGTNQPRKRTSAKNWLQPVKRNKQADVFFAEHGRRQRVFCASMADVFDNSVDPQWRSDLFALIAVTPNLDWLILTKRIGNAARMMAEATASAEMVVAEVAEFTSDNPWPNFWLGATICSQEEADRDIPKLLATPAAKRFLSIEPMLGAIDLEKIHHTNGYGCSPCSACDEPVYINSLYGNSYCKNCCDGAEHPSIDWVICGGESGPGARPMHPDWARSLRDQCDRACVPFLFKQWGEWAQAPFDHGRGWSRRACLENDIATQLGMPICDAAFINESFEQEPVVTIRATSISDARLAGAIAQMQAAGEHGGDANANWRRVASLYNPDFIKDHASALQAAYCAGEALFCQRYQSK